MRTEQFQVTSPADGLQLAGLLVGPDHEARGIVQFSHGMEEHKERYLEFMTYLATHGYVCAIHDHRGHGQSVRDVSDLGYFYENGAEAIVEDVAAVQAELRRRFPGLPLVLFGHSMGSLVVRRFIQQRDGDIQGLVVCGAPGANPATGTALFLINALSAVRGDHAKSRLLQQLVFGGYTKGLPGSHPLRWLSANEENVAAYDDDELCGFAFTLNGYANLMHLVQDAFALDGWAMDAPDLPILFVAGADDPVIGGEKGWLASQQFLRDRGYTQVRGTLYPGLRHEILNEREREKVYADVLGFIDGVCGLA